MATPSKLPSGKWRVRWKAPDGSRRSRTFDTKRPADLWAAEVTRRRQLGSLASLTPSSVTVEQLAIEWLHSASALAPSTRKMIAGVIDRHIVRWIGRAKVAQLDPQFVREWQAALASSGVTPDPRARALKYLRMLLNFAIESGYINVNPAASVKPPKIPAADPVRPLSPAQIESIRGQMDFHRDRLHVSLMAYAGLRPAEATSIDWLDVGKTSLSVYAPKTNRRASVKLLAPLQAEIAAWRMLCGNPESGLVIPPPTAIEWTQSNRANWRRRIFDPACEKAGIDATPYTLRHSFASLLVHAGYPLTYVAQQMRHGLELTFRTYAHVIEDFDPAQTIDPATEIAGAQNGHRGVM